MIVMHNFRKYLPTSQNWAYSLISNTPVDKVLIYSDQYLKTNFYSSQLTYLINPAQSFNEFMASRRHGALRVSRWSRIPLAVIQNILQKIQYKFYIASAKIYEVDIIHSHFGTEAIKKQEWVKETGCIHVVSFYGFDYEKRPREDDKVLKAYQRLFRAADAFVCEGQNGASILQRYGCPSDKVHVVRLGIPQSKVVATTKEKIAGKLDLVQIANITEKKGHIYTIRAFAKALKACPNMSLTLVGSVKRQQETWIMDEITRTIEEEGLAGNIKIVAGIDFSQLAAYLVQFDVFIHPSCYAKDYDCEGGAPVVLLDAQSVGLPVISTLHCDIPDEVVDGVTGMLSKERDTDDLALSIRRFYEMETEEYAEFSRRAIAHVRKNYDIEESGRTLSNLYKSLTD